MVTAGMAKEEKHSSKGAQRTALAVSASNCPRAEVTSEVTRQPVPEPHGWAGQEHQSPKRCSCPSCQLPLPLVLSEKVLPPREPSLGSFLPRVLPC